MGAEAPEATDLLEALRRSLEAVPRRQVAAQRPTSTWVPTEEELDVARQLGPHRLDCVVFTEEDPDLDQCRCLEGTL